MMNDERRQRLRATIAQGLLLGRSLGSAPMGPATDIPDDSPLTAMPWDCPPISRVAAGLSHGFTADEEAWARRSADFQRIVRLFWRVRPVSFWLLARSRVEGEQFPFAQALTAHLQENAGDATQVALSSPLTVAVEATLRGVSAGLSVYTRLQQRWLDWESRSHRFLAELPSTTAAFADTPAAGLTTAARFDDGLAVRVEEVEGSVLSVSASQPVAVGTGSLQITLLGRTDWVQSELALDGSGDFAGGRIQLGDLWQLRASLGNRCVVVVSREPIPTFE